MLCPRQDIIKELDPRRTKHISEDAFVEWWLENSDSTLGDSEAGGLEDWDEANIGPQEARSTTMINEASSAPGLLKLNKKVLEDKLQPFDDSDMDWNHDGSMLATTCKDFVRLRGRQREPLHLRRRHHRGREL